VDGGLGLSQRVEVSQYRLATHLVLALLIFAAIVWTLRRLARGRIACIFAAEITSVVLLVLTFVQLYFGALVAGLRAGRVYNTWPEIDGALIPSAARLFFETPWWRNLFDNTLTVQFEHRMTAYALLALALLHAIDAVRSRAGTARSTARGGWRPRSRCRRRSASSRCSIRCRSIWRWRIRPSRSWC
jgi:cytochrome c oxidase assembly protein subunit 15